MLNLLVLNLNQLNDIIHISISDIFLCFLLSSKTFSIRGVNDITIKTVIKIVSKHTFFNDSDNVMIVIG